MRDGERRICRCAPTALTVDEDALEPATVGYARARRAGQRARARRCSLRPGPLRAVLQHGRPLPRRHARRAGGAVAMRARAERSRPFAARGRRADRRDPRSPSRCSRRSASALSIWATSRSQHRAAVVEVAARQRTLAERYVKEVLLVRAGAQADPADDGAAPASERARAARRRHGAGGQRRRRRDRRSRAADRRRSSARQLEQERRLVADLTAHRQRRRSPAGRSPPCR